MKRTMTATLTVTITFLAIALGPQQQTVAQAPPDADMLVVYSAGLEKMFVDQKDQALIAALRMIPTRLEELPAELDAPQIPAPELRLVCDLLASPLTLRGGFFADGGAMPLRASLQLLDQMQDGPGLATRLQGFMKLSGLEPVEGHPGVQSIDLDGVPLFVQTDGGQLMVSLNDPGPVEWSVPETGLPDGVEPSMYFEWNGRAAQPFAEMFFSMMGEQAGMVREQLEGSGLVGPNATSLFAATGFGEDRAHGWLRYADSVPISRAAGMLQETPLSRSDLAMVPRDASFCQISQFKIPSLAQLLEQSGLPLEEMGEENPLEMVKAMIGIDIDADLIAHLGDTMGFYMSDTTGGGGIFSSIIFVDINNEAGMRSTLERLAEQANALASMHARGYVRCAGSRIGDVDMMTLTFPGLPVPAELCLTINRGRLIAGLSSQSVMAAVEQANSGRSGIASNPGFLEMGGDGWRGALGISYTDTERLARSGYGLTNMLCAALTNAVRSPAHPDRNTGPIMPAFNDFVRGCKPSVAVTRIVGDDVIMTTQGDRSVLVALSGGMGVISGLGVAGLAAAALGAGVALPAMGQARAKATEAQALSLLRQHAIAMHTFAADHDDEAPPDLAALEDYLVGVLASPFGPVPDHRGDYWMCTSQARMSESRYPNRQVAFYDRAMYANHDEVGVCFFDGHVELMSGPDFEMLTEEGPNAGVDFDLPH